MIFSFIKGQYLHANELAGRLFEAACSKSERLMIDDSLGFGRDDSITESACLLLVSSWATTPKFFLGVLISRTLAI